MKDFEGKGKPEILKKSLKTADQFTTISDLHFSLGTGNLVESFQSKSLGTKTYFVSRDKYSCFSLKAILEDFDFLGKVNSFEAADEISGLDS